MCTGGLEGKLGGGGGGGGYETNYLTFGGIRQITTFVGGGGTKQKMSGILCL